METMLNPKSQQVYFPIYFVKLFDANFLDAIDMVVDHRQIEGLLGRDPKNDIEYLVCYSVFFTFYRN